MTTSVSLVSCLNGSNSPLWSDEGLEHPSSQTASLNNSNEDLLNISDLEKEKSAASVIQKAFRSYLAQSKKTRVLPRILFPSELPLKAIFAARKITEFMKDTVYLSSSSLNEHSSTICRFIAVYLDRLSLNKERDNSERHFSIVALGRHISSSEWDLNPAEIEKFNLYVLIRVAHSLDRVRLQIFPGNYEVKTECHLQKMGNRLIGVGSFKTVFGTVSIDLKLSRFSANRTRVITETVLSRMVVRPPHTVSEIQKGEKLVVKFINEFKTASPHKMLYLMRPLSEHYYYTPDGEEQYPVVEGEWMRCRGNLCLAHSLLSKKKGDGRFFPPLSERYFPSLFLDLLDTLSHLHEKGIVHRDIKPLNILITEQGELRAYLSDYELVREMGQYERVPEAVFDYWDRLAWLGVIHSSTDVYGFMVTLCDHLFDGATSRDFAVVKNECRALRGDCREEHLKKWIDIYEDCFDHWLRQFDSYAYLKLKGDTWLKQAIDLRPLSSNLAITPSSMELYYLIRAARLLQQLHIEVVKTSLEIPRICKERLGVDLEQLDPMIGSETAKNLVNQLTPDILGVLDTKKFKQRVEFIFNESRKGIQEEEEEQVGELGWEEMY